MSRKARTTETESTPDDKALDSALTTAEEAAQLPDSEQPTRYADGSPVVGGTPVANGQQAQKHSETKRERFVRLIERRMPKALKQLSYVANLANRNQYSYTDGEATKIVADLMQAVQSLRAAYMGKTVEVNSWRLGGR